MLDVKGGAPTLLQLLEYVNKSTGGFIRIEIIHVSLQVNIGLLTSPAGRYAKALFQAALEEKQTISITQDLAKLTALYINHDLFRQAFGSHYLNRPQKAALWQDMLVILKITPLFSRFVLVLLEAERFNLISQIQIIFKRLVAAEAGIISVNIRTAVSLTKKQQERLEEVLMERFVGKISATYQSDPDLLSGIVIHHGSEVIDASLKGQLEAFVTNLRGAT